MGESIKDKHRIPVPAVAEEPAITEEKVTLDVLVARETPVAQPVPPQDGKPDCPVFVPWAQHRL